MKLTITDPNVATEAGAWCNEMFGHDGWDLWGKNLFSGKPMYEFWIFGEKNALMFKLRWSEYV